MWEVAEISGSETLVTLLSCLATSRVHPNLDGGTLTMHPLLILILLLLSSQLGSAQVAFVERRLLLGSIPLNLTTEKTISLKNTGHNHAYFEVSVSHHQNVSINLDSRKSVRLTKG